MTDELEFKANSAQAISEVKKLIMNLDELRAAQQKLKAQAKEVAKTEKQQFAERARATRQYVAEQNRLAAEQTRIAAQTQVDAAKIHRAIEAKNANTRKEIRLSREREAADTQAAHKMVANSARLKANAEARAEASRAEARIAEASARRYVAASEKKQTAMRAEVALQRQKNALPLARARGRDIKATFAGRVAVEQERQKTLLLRQQLREHNAIIAAKQKQQAVTSSLLVSWESIGRILAVRIGYQAISAFTRQLREGLASALKFQQALASVQTISQRSNLTTREWADGLQRVSDGWRLDIIEQTEAAYQALTNQVVHGSEAFEFLESANKFATVALVDTNEAVRIAASVINAYGKSAAQAEGIFASLFKTIELGRVRGGELTEIGRVLLPAQQLGVNYQEVLASLDVITKQGVKANEAMTFLRGIFQRMLRPTDKLREIFDEIGVSSGRAAFQTLGYAGVMERLQDIIGDDPELAGEVFQRMRSTAGFFAQQGRALQMLKKDYEEIINAQESYNNAAEIMRKTSAEHFQVMQSVVANIMTRTGSDIIDGISDATNGFKTLIPYVREAIRLFKYGLWPVTVAATGALVKLSYVLLATPIGLKIAAIGALITAYAWLRGSAERAAEAVRSVVQETSNSIRERLRQEAAYAQKVEEIADRVREERGRLALQSIAETVAGTNKSLRAQVQAATAAQEGILRVADLTRDKLRETIRTLEDGVKSAEDAASQALSGIIDLRTDKDRTLFDWDLERRNGQRALDFITRRMDTLSRQAATAASRGDIGNLDQLQQETRQLFHQRRQLEQQITKENERVRGQQRQLIQKARQDEKSYLTKRLDITRKIAQADSDQARDAAQRELRTLDAERNQALSASNNEYGQLQIHQIRAIEHERELSRLIDHQITQREELARVAQASAAEQNKALTAQKIIESQLEQLTQGIRSFRPSEVVALGDQDLITAQLRAQEERIQRLGDIAGRAGIPIDTDEMRRDFAQQTRLIEAQGLQNEVKERQRILEIKQRELAVAQQEARNRRDTLGSAIDDVTADGAAIYKQVYRLVDELTNAGSVLARQFEEPRFHKAIEGQVKALVAVRDALRPIQTIKSDRATTSHEYQRAYAAIGEFSRLSGRWSRNPELRELSKLLDGFIKQSRELPGQDGGKIGLVAAHEEYLGLSKAMKDSQEEMLDVLKKLDPALASTADAGVTQLGRLEAATRALNVEMQAVLATLEAYKTQTRSVLDAATPTQLRPTDSQSSPNAAVEKATGVGAVNVTIQAGPSGKINPSQITDAVRTAQRQGLLR